MRLCKWQLPPGQLWGLWSAHRPWSRGEIHWNCKTIMRSSDQDKYETWIVPFSLQASHMRPYIQFPIEQGFQIQNRMCYEHTSLISRPTLASSPDQHWPHLQTNIGLISRPTLVSSPDQHWSHLQTSIGLISRPTLASSPDQHWPHLPTNIGLISRPTLASSPDQHWPHLQTNIGLISGPTLVSSPDQYWPHLQINTGLISRPTLHFTFSNPHHCTWWDPQTFFLHSWIPEATKYWR